MTGRALDATQHILSRLGEIEHKVDSLGQTHAFALRASRDQIIGVVTQIFRNAKRKAQVYLAANGQRSVNEIADYLGMKRQNVGVILAALGDEDLLGFVSRGGRDIWHKLPIDRTIGITKILAEQYGLDRDGVPVAPKRKKQRK
jgi:hypothetical protein